MEIVPGLETKQGKKIIASASFSCFKDNKYLWTEKIGRNLTIQNSLS